VNLSREQSIFNLRVEIHRMTEITLKIDGMHCGSCIRRVTQAIHGAGGFEVEEVRLGAARFKEAEGSAPADATKAIAALAKAGYAARVDN